MVEVRIYRDGTGAIAALEGSGHAGWAEPGSDIICAAVSTLLQAAWFGLLDVAHVEVDAEKSPGLLRLRPAAAARHDIAAAAILETAARSIARLAEQHPDYIRARTISE